MQKTFINDCHRYLQMHTQNISLILRFELIACFELPRKSNIR